ncbi:non-specific serine/threonine protein kinase [Herbihabitans rhizosphaerae]|uniref:Non-specific serine/threonine protein kinase n=1 Tax=Herbihabitans rhizosphaerae TaxID=1872711 RepID=A0A4Q7L5H9_9PSEU|nr:LuxR C-terminal-related transcriptional regulator [Herbihabitans rhizosphaerae]RZS44889.1 non-specific serine/threonine protein kinase [Herbihabitans rhizosphaerae]
MPVRGSVETLPVEFTSYVGRQAELATAQRLLTEHRVLTLTGVGGVGKSRLAMRITTAVRDGFADGAAYVELAELRNADLLATTVADRLGLYDQSGRAALDVIIDHLRERQVLLVLDNCEHLVADCARMVSALVAACPGVTVLCTSRESLGAEGEQLLVVPPMSVPEGVTSTADLTGYEAVRLLVERATAVVPTFRVTEHNQAAIARVCEQLDGLPLAIELAAVRLRSLSVAQLADRLSDRLSLLTLGRRSAPRRQRTLRAMLDWSYELCSEPERAVLARASVFSGGFDLAAARHVCRDEDMTPDEIPDVLDKLVAKSLLAAGESRYRMLETVREYGADRLRSDDQQRVARRHRDWFAGLTAAYEAGWMGADQVTWVERIQREHPNIRVALDYCATEPGQAAAGLRMANQLDVYWTVRGFLSEARLWLNRMLVTVPPDTPERVFAQRLMAWCALLQGDIEAGTAALETGTELADRVGDEVSTAYVTVGWGLANLFTHKESLARDQFAEALAVFREHGVAHGEGYAGFLHGLATAVTGDVETGRALIDERIQAGEAIGENFWRSWGLWALGITELFYGDEDAAERAALEAFRLQEQLGNRSAQPFAVHVIGAVAVRRGRMDRSATLSGIALRMWQSLGANPDRFGLFTTKILFYGNHALDVLGEAEYYRHYLYGNAMTWDQVLGYLLGESGTTPRENQLTKREHEIAGLLAEGLSNQQIAAKLFIAPRTAETHVGRILTKLGFHDRAQVAGWHAAQNPPA